MNSENGNARGRGRRLRVESTDAERKLWAHLRAKRFVGFKFRRQHRIGPYFADFCCVSARLIVEIDGGQHCGAGRGAQGCLENGWSRRDIVFCGSGTPRLTKSLKAFWKRYTRR